MLQDEPPKGKLRCRIFGHNMVETRKGTNFEEETCKWCGSKYFPDSEQWASPFAVKVLTTERGPV